jgi:hypothetical protein
MSCHSSKLYVHLLAPLSLAYGLLQMNTISPRLARAQDNWASEYMAQQYMQNWRKNQKKPRQDVVSDDEEDRSSADNDDDDSSDDDDDE